MMAGLSAGDLGAVGGAYDAPPDDTGEALDLPPAGLTITFGFGPSPVSYTHLDVYKRQVRR